MVKDSKAKAESNSNIVVTAGYIERLLQARQTVTEMRRKGIPDKLGYWLARATQKAERESKAIQEQRQEIIRRHAKLEGDEVKLYDKTDPAKGVRKGDIVWKSETERAVATREIQELLETSVELSMHPIKVRDYIESEKDLELSWEDWDLIIPLCEEL